MRRDDITLFARRAITTLLQLRETDLESAGRALRGIRSIWAEYEEDSEVHVELAQRALAAWRAEDLRRFDLFAAAGFKPKETALSDALKTLLDPRQHHGLGKRPLKGLLRALLQVAPRRARAILAEVEETDANQIRVQRERDVGNTRVDLEIRGPSFGIFIENKIRGGHETSHEEGPQTVRQAAALSRLASRYGDPDDPRFIGILLSPEGHRAASPEFIPLTASRLSTALRRELAGEPPRDAIINILAFLDFYSWSN
jgi:hypothetical protein